MMVTYRKYSHTDRMGYPRLEECSPPTSCGYSQCEIGVIPVVLATGPCLERSGSMPVPACTTRLKAPTIPGPPPGLPEEFDLCVQENGSFIRHRDTNHRLHGAHVSTTCWTDEDTGIRMCRIDVGGDAEMVVPACVDESVHKEPLPDNCCVNIETATLICPGSSYDGLVVEVVREYEQDEFMEALVAHPDLPDGGGRIPVCVNLEPDVEAAPACIEEKTGQLIAPESSVLAAFNGQLIPPAYFECKNTPEGDRICMMKCGEIGNPGDEVEAFLQHICSITGRRGFPACEIVGDRPDVRVPKHPQTPPGGSRPPKYLHPVDVPQQRPPVPQLCCLNPDTKSLVCEGTPYDGLVVEIVTQTTLPNGMEIASVAHPSLPGGGARVPICRETPPQRRPTPKRPPTRTPPPSRVPPPKVPAPECCIFRTDEGRYHLECEPSSHRWHGRDVTEYTKCYQQNDGSEICVVKFEEGDTRVVLEIPLCDEPPGRTPPPVIKTPPPRREPPPRRTPPPRREPPPTRTPPPREPPKRKPPKYPTPSFLPDNVCYSMLTGRLEAEGTKWHGVEVRPISIGAIKDGMGMILVEHEDFIGGRASVPICRGSCYPEEPRKYGMTYRGTPHDIRRYSGFSGRPEEILEQRYDNEFMDSRLRSFRPNSPGPDIHLLHQANLPISPWGRVGHAHPPNITGNPEGHNTNLFRNKQDVADALLELGYRWEGDRKFEFSQAVRQFQGDWNKISNSIPAKRALQEIGWIRVPRGNVVPDGFAGPVTQNALEIALVNQRAGLPWEKVMLINEHAERGYPKREHVYDARQRDLGRRHIQPPIHGTGVSRRK